MKKIAILAAVAALGLSAAAPATTRAAEPAAEGIMKYAINKPSTAWNVYGPGQTNAPVKDKAVIGGGGIRVQVTAPTPDKPWTNSAGQAVGGKIAKGDIITIAFWAKAEPVDGGPATATITSVRVQQSAEPWGGIVEGKVAVTERRVADLHRQRPRQHGRRQGRGGRGPAPGRRQADRGAGTAVRAGLRPEIRPGDDGQVERLSPHVLDERRQVLAQIGQVFSSITWPFSILVWAWPTSISLSGQYSAETLRSDWRRASWARTVPVTPGEAPTMQAVLPERAEGEPREAQSMAFFSTPVTPPLYSGQASSRASAERTASFQALTGAGSPWSSTSWLNSGRSCRPKISIVTPSGAHSWAARSRAVLNEAARRLPETPRSFM
jgi:hypothetical protein